MNNVRWLQFKLKSFRLFCRLYRGLHRCDSFHVSSDSFPFRYPLYISENLNSITYYIILSKTQGISKSFAGLAITFLELSDKMSDGIMLTVGHNRSLFFIFLLFHQKIFPVI